MDVIHPRCAGLDVSKGDAKVCVRVAVWGQGWDEVDRHDVVGDDQPGVGVA